VGGSRGLGFSRCGDVILGTAASAVVSPFLAHAPGDVVIALVGMPFVLAYTVAIHRVFKGKVPAGAGYSS
jgi:hypothetical protein